MRDVYVDRETVLTILAKRFPEARLCDIAAAANAIVGLEPDYAALTPAELRRLDCETAERRYTTHHVTTGELRVYHRVRR
jgi:hypothetical protein